MPDMSKNAVGVVGAGKLGQALARLLAEAGEPVTAVASRNPEHAKAGAEFAGTGVRAVRIGEIAGLAARVLICVSDDAIAVVASRLAETGMRDGVALHVSGALGPAVLEPLERAGVSCGVLHPLQTIPNPHLGLEALWRIYWGVTARGEARRWAASIIRLLDGRLLEIPPEKRALYHAAGCMACNCFVALEDAARMMMEAAGAGRGEALEALAPMVEATRRNIFEYGTTEALTGPISRGDVETVRRHLEALAALPDTVRDFYCAAALRTLAIARRRGLEEPLARRFERLLRDNGIRDG